MRGGFAVAFGAAAGAVACAAVVGLDDPASIAAVEGDAATNGVDGTTTPTDGTAPDSTPPREASIDAGSCGDPDLLAYWRFDEGTGTSVADCSKYGHTGTLAGDAGWASGRAGGSALDVTLDDFVRFGDPAALRLIGAFSVTAWINVRSVTNAGRVVTKSGQPGNRGWELNFEPNAELRFRIALDGATHVDAIFAPFTALSVWKHVAGAYEPGAFLRLYIDGVQVAENTASIPNAQRNSTNGPQIGRRADCCPFDGRIDEVRIYARALSAAEVKAIAAP
jgi:hypothetical protein